MSPRRVLLVIEAKFLAVHLADSGLHTEGVRGTLLRGSVLVDVDALPRGVHRLVQLVEDRFAEALLDYPQFLDGLLGQVIAGAEAKERVVGQPLRAGLGG